MSIQRILEVATVEVHKHKTQPPRLHVTATGNASSGSHFNPCVEKRVYIIFPEDGIQEYDFLIDVPDGPGTSDIKSHTVEDEWDEFPDELKGVRVYAKTNVIEKLLNSKHH